MAEARIVVTAAGIITALGAGCAAQAAALQAGRSGLRYPELLCTKHRDFLVGEVAQSNEALAAGLGVDKEHEGITRTTLLAMAGLKDLIKNSGAGAALFESPRTAFINASTVGGMSEVEQHYPQFMSEEGFAAVRQYIDTLDCAESTTVAARHFGFRGLDATISTACSSSANAIMLGARYIRMGIADAAVCGGADALSRFTLNGFHSLKNVDKAPCRPFDQNRMGLNLGEGAAFLLLEKESDAKARGAKILAVLSGYSNTNDAYHPTAPSPDGSGALRTMEAALKKAGIDKEAIGYINAHGTATINNDLAEGKAITQLWEGAPPPFSSTKPFTGHTLAAAGAVEAIFSIIALNENMLPQNLNFSQPMEELEVAPVAGPGASAGLDHVLSNSFGFGGNNSTLVFSKP